MSPLLWGTHKYVLVQMKGSDQILPRGFLSLSLNTLLIHEPICRKIDQCVSETRPQLLVWNTITLRICHATVRKNSFRFSGYKFDHCISRNKADMADLWHSLRVVIEIPYFQHTDEIRLKWATHELHILTEFYNNWVKMVDFFIKAIFLVHLH